MEKGGDEIAECVSGIVSVTEALLAQKKNAEKLERVIADEKSNNRRKK